MPVNYGINGKRKNHLLKAYLRNKKGYRRIIKLAVALYTCAIASCCFFTILFPSGTSGKIISGVPVAVVGLLFGAVVGCVPFLVGQWITAKAVKKYGEPFFERRNEFIRLEDSCLVYGYHPFYDKNINCMNVYTIDYRMIQGLSYDEKHAVLSIIGKGQITVYDDILMTVPNSDLSGKRFYPDSCYQVMLAIAAPEEFIKALKEKMTGEQ